ncbi:MAG: nucleotide exchange factor GrpE [Eubacteriales bacterium]|nr:nucleotide exchange factor GrpE [Eubacteriales bacterium]
MSFFRKDKTQKESEMLLRRVEEKLHAMEQAEQARQEKDESFQQELQKLEKEVKKHNMTIEDLLDVLEEQQEEKETARRKEQEYKTECEKLLSVFEAYQEQFWQIKKHLDGNGTWKQMFALMEEEQAKEQMLCGISLIGRPGEKVDYSLHEVIEAVDTEEQGKDKQIANVYSPGYLYQGKVRKKARVSAYRAAAQNEEQKEGR